MTERPIPCIQPANITEPWLVAFTALAQDSDGMAFDYTANNDPAERNKLAAALQPLSLTWLTLNHGTNVIVIPRDQPHTPEHLPVADAAVVTQPGYAAALTTADCLPVIVASPTQHHAAVIHAGWRGIAHGIIGSTLKCMAELATTVTGSLTPTLHAWIGPSIHQEDYEVGAEVRRELLKAPSVTPAMFAASANEKFLADLQAMARAQLIEEGVPRHSIVAHPTSTLQSPSYHSVRRDGERAGRMATVVGILGSTAGPFPTFVFSCDSTPTAPTLF